MLFSRPSTRTRVSFEVGVQRLGGISVVLDEDGSQMSRGESLQDTAAVLSRYADAIVYRAASHDDILAVADHATVPVVNALTELEHPCQALADIMTLQEHLGPLPGRTIAYVGDGNNVCASLMQAAAWMGMHVRVACPDGFGPHQDAIRQTQDAAALTGGSLTTMTDPHAAVKGADAVVTDTWISMGDEAEAEARRQAFAGYCVDDAMMELAGPEAIFMHCLPGHWGEEATDAVAHGPRSVIYDEAENRMWTQMALLVHLASQECALPA